MKRCAGVLLAISSLPSDYGIGDFGGYAYRFIDDLNKANFKIWQILPLNPLGFGNSPYQPLSSKAIDPIYISLDILKEEKLLTKTEKLNESANKVFYEEVRAYKEKKLELAYSNFKKKENFKELEKWHKQNPWVDNYAVFVTLKKLNDLRMWTEWPKEQQEWINDKKFKLGRYKDKINREIWYQFVAFKQFENIKKYANSKGIEIMGDIPFYVGVDSIDVWENQKCFLLDEKHNPAFIAGVPPDIFSKTGQRWGNPIYDWDYIKKTGFKFWIDRLMFNANLFDIIRIDHFRAFDTYWKVPASCPTAEVGTWEKCPGYEFFDTLFAKYKDVKIVAEDLGDLVDSVLVLRDHYNFPGMNILQFTFEPYKYDYGLKDKENQIIYTGTHDNETINGWIARISDDERNAVRAKLERLNHSYPDFAYSFCRLALDNKANYCILPMQDIMSLDNSARMNTPSTIGSPNWEFKLVDFNDFENRLDYLRDLINQSGRNN